MIDEVQYAPELFPYIKMIVDKRKLPGDFWLTGSQMFRMMKNVTETLAGRAGIVPMLGLSNSEIQARHLHPFEIDIPGLIERMNVMQKLTVTEVFERIFKGSMPRLYEIDDVNLNTYFESYLSTYLSRDVKALEQVAKETAFINFIRVAAARTATILNYEAMANEVGITSPTAKHWLSMLKPIQKATDEATLSGASHIKTTVGTGAVICLCSDILPIDKQNWYIPAWII